MKYDRTRELYGRYAGALEPWQAKLALTRIRRFRLPPDAWDDAMQELAIVIHAFRFDPAKAHSATEQTVLCTALDNRIRTMARSAVRRAACLERVSALSEPQADTHTPETDAAHADVRRIVASLAPQQRETCLALMQGMTIHQIARKQGVAWCTIERQIASIRQALSERGIDPWQR